MGNEAGQSSLASTGSPEFASFIQGILGNAGSVEQGAGNSTETEGATTTETTTTTPPAKENGKDGFPEGTPVSEMTHEQQAAYWKHQSRKHEAAARKTPKQEATPTNEQTGSGGFDMNALAELIRTEIASANAVVSQRNAEETAKQLLATGLKNAGHSESELDYINVGRFVSNGAVDSKEIEKFLASRGVQVSTGSVAAGTNRRVAGSTTENLSPLARELTRLAAGR